MGLFKSEPINKGLCDLCGDEYHGLLLCDECMDLMKKRWENLEIEKPFLEWLRERYNE